MTLYQVVAEKDGKQEVYGCYANKDWAIINLAKARDWYWQKDKIWLAEIEVPDLD